MFLQGKLTAQRFVLVAVIGGLIILTAIYVMTLSISQLIKPNKVLAQFDDMIMNFDKTISNQFYTGDPHSRDYVRTLQQNLNTKYDFLRTAIAHSPHRELRNTANEFYGIRQRFEEALQTYWTFDSQKIAIDSKHQNVRILLNIEHRQNSDWQNINKYYKVDYFIQNAGWSYFNEYLNGTSVVNYADAIDQLRQAEAEILKLKGSPDVSVSVLDTDLVNIREIIRMLRVIEYETERWNTEITLFRADIKRLVTESSTYYYNMADTTERKTQTVIYTLLGTTTILLILCLLALSMMYTEITLVNGAKNKIHYLEYLNVQTRKDSVTK